MYIAVDDAYQQQFWGVTDFGGNHVQGVIG